MNSEIRGFLESKGFETNYFDQEMWYFVKTDKSIIIEIVGSDTDFYINIKSNISNSNLALNKKFIFKRIELVNGQIKNENIISAFYICLNEFEQTLINHIKNIKTIQTIFQ